MRRNVAIGIQNFETLIQSNCFYVDKTDLIKEWWDGGDSVTLITRPRRFGKTLNISMLEYFFSNEYEDRGDLFEGLSIWKEEKYRKLQGTYPVISISFANIKGRNFNNTRDAICQTLTNLYSKYDYLRKNNVLTEKEREYFDRISVDMSDNDAAMALNQLSGFLCRYYGKKVVILLDEYDTPMQEAYVNGFWDELVDFTRSIFNASFKTNPYLERAMMTGITRISKESIFSDLNNLKVITTTSDEYATAFGFTEEEVFAAIDEIGMVEKKDVKRWYDGFVFGSVSDIYNPWSIINLLDTGKYNTYWANTSSNNLVGKLIREGSRDIKEQVELLLQGGVIESEIDEQIIFSQLDDNPKAIWSLLLAGGYLRVVKAGGFVPAEDAKKTRITYSLALTNMEVLLMFEDMVQSWFAQESADYNDFIKALLLGDLDAMNEYMNRISESVFSNFDTGKKSSRKEPERFYHGFILGLVVELQGRYLITSNRESGFGRYDIMLEPMEDGDAIIMEFKVFNKRKEKILEDTLAAALAQIEEKDYARSLIDKGIPEERIHKYGFAFEGKTVLIG